MSVSQSGYDLEATKSSDCGKSSEENEICLFSTSMDKSEEIQGPPSKPSSAFEVPSYRSSKKSVDEDKKSNTSRPEKISNMEPSEEEIKKNTTSSHEAVELPKKPKTVTKRISPPLKVPSPRPQSGRVASSIPLPVRSPKPAECAVRTPSKLSNKTTKASTTALPTKGMSVSDRHTLEIQFINKKKRLKELKAELQEKQKPVMDLYQNLVQLKKKLEDLGKSVQLDEIKLLPYNPTTDKIKSPRGTVEGGGGEAFESLDPTVIIDMKTSIEEIPKTLMTICQNLVSRRAVIVELLESVTKSEVDISEISDKIDSLKSEGTELQKSLDVIIGEHESKINQLVSSWQKLLNDKCDVTRNQKIEELESKVKEQEKLIAQSHGTIQDLQRKLDDKKSNHDKSVAELDNVIRGLKDHIRRLELENEQEKRAVSEHKNRNANNMATIKSLKNRITELESRTRESDDRNQDLNKKVKFLQDQMKSKEGQWSKEKEDMAKSIKHQESLLQKITADRNQFETRVKIVEEKTGHNVSKMQKELDETKEKLRNTEDELQKATVQKKEAIDRCKVMEETCSRLGSSCKGDISLISRGMEWGKALPSTEREAEVYTEVLANKIMMKDYEDKVKQYERERELHLQIIKTGGKVSIEALGGTPEEAARLKEYLDSIKTPICDSDMERTLTKQNESIVRYQKLLEESEEKLRAKSVEVAKLTTEIRHLKVRQDALEEQNYSCPTMDLQKMVEEGRSKLNELMKKSLESEQRIAHYEGVIDKQNKQMNEMENLLRYRENMTGVLKASRDELIMEKDSLTRYSQEMRTVLAEVTKEGKIKDRLVKELQEKLELRERQISKLEREVRELEANLMMTNEKRFKLQETIGTMEKELQSTKAHVNQLADIQTRYEIGMNCSKSSITHTDHFNMSPDSYIVEQLNVNNVNCTNELGTNSLLGLSLRKVDFLRTRVQYLTKMSLHNPYSGNSIKSTKKDQSSQTSFGYRRVQKNFEKMLDLTTKRYDSLHKQAFQSFGELHNLLKLSIANQLPLHNTADDDNLSSSSSSASLAKTQNDEGVMTVETHVEPYSNCSQTSL